jgi:hypothetical protein
VFDGAFEIAEVQWELAEILEHDLFAERKIAE